MTMLSGSRRAAAVVSASTMGVLILGGSPVHAQAVATVNGVDITGPVFDFYVLNRTQRQAADLTAQEREALLGQITDIYLLSTQDSADALQNDPVFQAQIELQMRSLMAQEVANQFINAVTVTDEEVQAEYESQAVLAPGQQFKARHILVESQGEALAIIAELDGGADFATLAQERSTGPSGPNGGDLSWFTPEQMVPEFSQAVVALSNGEYSAAPVQTQFGWHVILREDSRALEPPPLDSVRENIVQAIKNRRFQDYLQQIRDDAN